MKKQTKINIIMYLVLWIITIITSIISQLGFDGKIQIKHIVLGLVFSTIIYTTLKWFLRDKK